MSTGPSLGLPHSPGAGAEAVLPGAPPTHGDYQAVVDRLARLNAFGVRPGLHRMAALLDHLGNPHETIPNIVHVAGTNGKGSVTALLGALLRAMGRRTALFTSPHLTCYGERFCLDGRPLDREAFAAAVAPVWPAVAAVTERLGEEPVQFEVLAAAMYLLAAREGFPWLIQETGLGGRLDATNLVARPALAVITSIAVDHADRLGGTLAAIAAEKAAIIKEGVPVVTTLRGEPWRVVAEAARAQGCPVHRIVEMPATPGPVDEPAGDHGVVLWRYRVLANEPGGVTFQLMAPPGAPLSGIYRVPLAGRHQGENAAAALAGLYVLGRTRREAVGPVTKARIQAGLDQVRWPARLETLPGSPSLVVDGGHNPAAMAVLRSNIEELFPGRPLALVCGVVKGKDLAGMAAAWAGAPGLGMVHAVPVPGVAGYAPDQVAAAFRAAGLAARPWDGPGEALEQAARAAGPEGVVIVCGSLYLAGWARTCQF